MDAQTTTAKENFKRSQISLRELYSRVTEDPRAVELSNRLMSEVLTQPQNRDEVRKLARELRKTHTKVEREIRKTHEVDEIT